ncbi:SRPBCC domain-containing protein [Bacteroidota bacterium]
MTTIESKIGTIPNSEEGVFNFLTDFRNFDSYIPPDKVDNWESSSDKCSFSLKNMGEISVEIVEKNPYNFIKISPEGKIPFKFNFYIQLKQVGENDTKIKLSIKAELNQMMKMMVKKPLKKGLDDIIDQFTRISYTKN